VVEGHHSVDLRQLTKTTKTAEVERERGWGGAGWGGVGGGGELALSSEGKVFPRIARTSISQAQTSKSCYNIQHQVVQLAELWGATPLPRQIESVRA